MNRSYTTPVSQYKSITQQLQYIAYANILYGVISFIGAVIDVYNKHAYYKYIPEYLPNSIALSTAIIGTMLTTVIQYTAEIQIPALIIQGIGATWCTAMGLLTPIISRQTSFLTTLVNLLGGGMNVYALYLLIQLKQLKQLNKRV